MSKKEFLISVDDDGRLVHIYDDEIAFLSDLGSTKTSRASHVEPTDDNLWTADMSPVNGPLLGPFSCHQDALNAEFRWIEENVL